MVLALRRGDYLAGLVVDDRRFTLADPDEGMRAMILIMPEIRTIDRAAQDASEAPKMFVTQDVDSHSRIIAQVLPTLDRLC
jgi:hypothetical protein